MADVQVRPLGVTSVPAAAVVPGSAEWLVKVCYASFDGSAAATSYQPCLRVVSDAGIVVAESCAATVAAGASADVSWFPGEVAAAAATGGGIQFDTDPQAGDWLVVTTTGTDPGTGIGTRLEDTGGGGIEIFTTGFSNDGGGVYIECDDSSGSFPVALQVQGNETGVGEVRGIQVDANAPSAGATSVTSGIVSNAEGTAAGGAQGISATGSTLYGSSGTAEAIGVVGQGLQTRPTAAGATGARLDAQNHGSGHAIGVDATGEGQTGSSGDIIGGRFTAKNDPGGAGTLYGLQVFIGATKVFQINADGSLHGLTGQALTFDL